MLVGGFGAFLIFLVLSVIVVIRILLSISLEVEMDGMWPWKRWRRLTHRPAKTVATRFTWVNGARTSHEGGGPRKAW